MLLSIVLAEDPVINQKMLLRMLQHLGYQANAVGNGLRVLKALCRQFYGVVLADVVIDLEALQELRDKLGKDATMLRVIETDRENIPHLSQILYLAAEIRDASGLKSTVHMLKLSNATLGINRLYQLGQGLEDIAVLAWMRYSAIGFQAEGRSEVYSTQLQTAI